MDNLEIYNLGRSVPEEAKKAFNNGSFSGTDINPVWRIKKLTEIFGPAGIGWYTEVTNKWSENVNGEILVSVELNLYVRYNGEWSKPIYGVGGNKALQVFPGKNGQPDKAKISDEAYKMAYTDAISVACKALGIGADVYFEKDKTKYTAAQPSESAKAPASKAKVIDPGNENWEAAVAYCAKNGFNSETLTAKYPGRYSIAPEVEDKFNAAVDQVKNNLQTK